MEIKSIDNFRLVDRNKASASVEVLLGEEEVQAEWVFYLQSDYCVSIRVGNILRGSISIGELEDQVFENRVHIKALIKPDIVRVRAERRALMGYDT